MPDKPTTAWCPTKAQADLFSCFIGALFACAPCFIESFMNCMAGGNSGNGGDGTPYEPGDRNRCGQQTQPPEK